MIMNRFHRALCAFSRSTQRWTPINYHHQETQTISLPSRRIDSLSMSSLSLVSWNIDAFSSRPAERAKRIVSHILARPKLPDIVCLQEVTPSVRIFLLDNARVRDAFLVTDAEDGTCFKDVPFATMTMLSRICFDTGPDLPQDDKTERHERFMIRGVSRVRLPSKYRREALYIDIILPRIPGVVLRLVNVHLDSLEDTLLYRAQQMEILGHILREPGCSGGLIAGDFNAISSGDDGLLGKNGLVDAWVSLHGVADLAGATWGVGIERQDGLRQGRLDKIAMTGVTATDMKVLRPGLIEVPVPGGESREIPWSDHCGLTCTFTV